MNDMNNHYTGIEISAMTGHELGEAREGKKPFPWKKIFITTGIMMVLYAFYKSIDNECRIEKLTADVNRVDEESKKLWDKLHLERARMESEMGVK